MRLEHLRLENFGPFEELALPFAPNDNHKGNVTVFIGENGAGKSKLFQSIQLMMQRTLRETQEFAGDPQFIPPDFIEFLAPLVKKGAELFSIEATLKSLDANKLHFAYLMHLPGVRSWKFSPRHLSELAVQEGDSTQYPIILFFPSVRSAEQTPLEVDQNYSFDIKQGYEGALNAEADFADFFEWYRHREDLENEQGMSSEGFFQVVKQAEHKPALVSELKELYAKTRDKQMETVRRAIQSFLPGFSNFRVRRSSKKRLEVDKNGQTLNFLQLSQGERHLFAMVGDIARRLAILNRDAEDPLLGKGIVAIDECEQSLHPTWQRQFIPNLTRTFPNVQFILTTHSPLIISEAPDLLVYHLENGKAIELPSMYGQDANMVLLEAMHTPHRNQDVETQINDARKLIQENRFQQAEAIVEKLESILYEDHIELVKLRLLMRKEALRHADHSKRPGTESA